MSSHALAPARELPRAETTSGALLVLLAASLLLAGPASAHVTVSSPDAEPGGYAKLVFRVPNESDRAGTVELSVELPVDTPFAAVQAKPVPGWTVETAVETLPEPTEVGGATLSEAITSVAWIAEEGNSIEPGQFNEFELSVGPMPEDAASMMFPAVQTYSDGEVVHWDQPSARGEEPEHPAPVLELAAMAENSDGEQAAEQGNDVSQVAADTSTGSDGVARALAGAGLLVALAALGAVLLRRRSTT